MVEILVATTITVGLGAVIFQLLHQGGRVFRDQGLMLEMQQTARAATAQIADDIRLAGQGVPVYAATNDSELSEASSVILAGSDSSRLHLRAGLSNATSNITNFIPLRLATGSATTLTVGNAAELSNLIGTSPAGRYAYVWGTTRQGWRWARVAVHSIAAGSRSIRVTPVESGAPVIEFSAAPEISLEEAVAVYRDSATNSIRRATATNMSDPANAVWAPANEIAANVTALTFIYYDRTNSPVLPDTLAHRSQVVRIDVRVVVRTAGALSNHSRPTYALSTRSIPRNLRVR